jgi:hypothetical protein
VQIGTGTPTTASPDTVFSAPDVVTTVTQEMADAARQRGLTIPPVGAEVRVPMSDVRANQGLAPLLPQSVRNNALSSVPPAPAGNRALTVVTTPDGKPVSETNRPRAVRQLKDPNAPPAAAAPAPAAAPVTPAPATAPPPAPAPPPAAPAAPVVPPRPPAVTPPALPPGTAPGTSPGHMVPTMGSINPLTGGVQVASNNPLAARYPGSVQVAANWGNGTMSDVPGGASGMTFGAPAPGIQKASNYVVGPGSDEQVIKKLSQDRFAADSAAASNFQANVFPQTQALSLLGRDTVTTGPGSDALNTAKGWAGAAARRLGFTGVFDSTKDYDEIHKLYNQIVTTNPVAQGSDARMAQVLGGNANTGIHEQTSADVMKASIALMRMNATAVSQWQHMTPAERAPYGYYTNYLQDFNKTADPRAFMQDMLNSEQKKRLRDQLNKASEADKQNYWKYVDMARGNGYMPQFTPKAAP